MTANTTAAARCAFLVLLSAVGYLWPAPRPAQAQTPPITNGLRLWLSADTGVTTNASGLVSLWADQSGAGNNVSQSSDSLKPTWLSTGINGQPTLHFAGGLLDNTLSDIVASGSARTVFIVARADNSGNGGSLFAFRRSATIFGDLLVNLGVNAFYVYTDGVNPANNATIPDSNYVTIFQPFVSTFESAGTGNPIQVFLNGTDRGATHRGGAVSAETGTTGFTVGNREDYSLQPWRGSISEVLVYNDSLTASDRLLVTEYLGDKYSIAVPEPATICLSLLVLAAAWVARQRVIRG